MKKIKKITALALLFVLLFGLVSCGMKKEETFSVKETLTDEEERDEKKKTFTSMSVTLNGNFKQYEPLPIFGNYSAIFDSSKAKVMVINRAIESEYYSVMTAYEYAAEQAAGLGHNSYPVGYDAENGLAWYRYNSSIFGSKFSGVCYVFREGNDFWLIDMACSPDDIDDMLPYFEEWAKSVSFEQHPMYDYVIE